MYICKPENIEPARILLNKWADSYIRVHTEWHQTYNFHIVSQHLIQDVLNHGSLIGHSAFSLEGILGLILHDIHGTTGLKEQYIKC